MKIRKGFGKISMNPEPASTSPEPRKLLKSIWKKLGINGQIKNFSSQELWALETDTGAPVARRLLPGFKTPPSVDCDAFKRTDKKPIEGHDNWWKFYDVSTAEVFDASDSLRVSALTKVAVDENHFGKTDYRNEPWGSRIQLVIDVRRDHHKKITAYLVSDVGWVSPDKALSMACLHEIDNARPVFPSGKPPYIRTKRDLDMPNNLSVKGLA
jgi:hypothetical protein